MIRGLYKKHLPLMEFALRIYIAYFLADYGISKLTGGMFANASPAVLKTELQQVDIFHLTWYFFYKSKLLSGFVGVCQLLAAALLLVNRTVLLGCMLAIPIMVAIFLIDATVFPDFVLAARVFFYIACLGAFIAYRRDAVAIAWRGLTGHMPAVTVGKKSYWLLIPLFMVFYLIVEVVVCWAFR